MSEGMTEPVFSAADQERKDWLHSFIDAAAARVHETYSAEPPTEPQRAQWHWSRNMMLMGECGKAGRAYAERFGEAMPERWRLSALALEHAHHTNPYPGSTVQRMAFDSP